MKYLLLVVLWFICCSQTKKNLSTQKYRQIDSIVGYKLPLGMRTVIDIECPRVKNIGKKMVLTKYQSKILNALSTKAPCSKFDIDARALMEIWYRDGGVDTICLCENSSQSNINSGFYNISNQDVFYLMDHIYDSLKRATSVNLRR